MGRVFLDHPGGLRIYSCANCDTPLTNRSELVSTVSEKEGFRLHGIVCVCPYVCGRGNWWVGPAIWPSWNDIHFL